MLVHGAGNPCLVPVVTPSSPWDLVGYTILHHRDARPRAQAMQRSFFAGGCACALSCHPAACIRAQYRLALPSYFFPRFRLFSSSKRPHHNLLRKTTSPPAGRCPVILNKKSSMGLTACACVSRLPGFRQGCVCRSVHPLKSRQSHLIQSRQSLIVSCGFCRPHRS